MEFWDIVWGIFKQHYMATLFDNLDADMDTITNTAINMTKHDINKKVEQFLIEKVRGEQQHGHL